nr:M28 family peptidase [Armatimonadota bacterium]
MIVRCLAPRMTALLALFAVLTFSLAPSPVRADAASDAAKVDPTAAVNYTKLAHGIQAARLQDAINKLSDIHYTIPASADGPAVTAYSRVAGTPGGEQAHQYVQGQFNQIFGAPNVQAENFTVTTPETRGASVAAGGRTYALQPLWPNLVRTSTLPQRGVDGPLIYAGRGDLRAFRGKTVEGSIVLLDFNCGTQWLNAARLGALAIIFIEPAQTMRGEAESKFIGIPIAIPRFWMTRADAAALQSAALTTPNFKVHLAADNPWMTNQAYNVIGKIPGTDPVLGKQIVVIESYFDSMSIVPTQAHGAESACGLSTMLELARTFKANPPKRTVWFVASGAHFLGLQGIRSYVDLHLDSWQQPSAGDKFSAWLHHTSVPERSQVMLFSGLDLTSQTGTVGVFYKGYFYDYREVNVATRAAGIIGLVNMIR